MTPWHWFVVAGGVVTVCFGLVAAWGAWRDRPPVVKGSDGRWRAPRPYHNGWGERR